MTAAWEDGRAVGGAGAFPFVLTVPGGSVRAAGITAVGVLPTHRRRGILRSMMRTQLDACRDQGEAVAYLWATEDKIYGRFGYGIASFSAEVELPRERSSYYAAAEPIGRARLVLLRDAEALIPPVYERVAIATPGMMPPPSTRIVASLGMRNVSRLARQHEAGSVMAAVTGSSASGSPCTAVVGSTTRSEKPPARWICGQ